MRKINKGIRGAIECEALLKESYRINDSLTARHYYRDTLETLLVHQIENSDKIKNGLQQNNNSYVEMIAKKDSFIRQIEKLKWYQRLFKQKEIIKVYLNNTP